MVGTKDVTMVCLSQILCVLENSVLLSKLPVLFVLVMATSTAKGHSDWRYTEEDVDFIFS